jgi:hypothetical protein
MIVEQSVEWMIGWGNRLTMIVEQSVDWMIGWGNRWMTMIVKQSDDWLGKPIDDYDCGAVG